MHYVDTETTRYATRTENSIYNCDVFFFWVSTMCAQTLGFSRVSAMF